MISNNIMKFTQFDNEHVAQVWEKIKSVSRAEDQQAASQAVLNNPSLGASLQIPNRVSAVKSERYGPKKFKFMSINAR